MSVAGRKPTLIESMGLGGASAMFAVNFTQYVPFLLPGRHLVACVHAVRIPLLVFDDIRL